MNLSRKLLATTLAACASIAALPLPGQTSDELDATFRALASSDPREVERAEADVRVLWKELWSGDIGPYLPELGELLRSETSQVRLYSALTLAGAAVNSAESARSLQDIAPILITVLGDPDTEVRRAAAAAVASMRPTPPPEATASLLDLIDDPKLETREAALAALVRIKPAPPELREVLVEQVREESTLQAQAIGALGGMNVREAEVVELVISRLGSSNAAVRTQAIQALAHWGEAARLALPELRRIGADPAEDETLRMLASNAVERIMKKEMEP